MLLKPDSLALFARVFGISLAGYWEQGVKVLLYYKNGERLASSFNGGTPLREERPWEMTAPIARYLYQRGVEGEFALRLIYTEEKEYKLKEILPG